MWTRHFCHIKHARMAFLVIPMVVMTGRRVTAVVILNRGWQPALPMIRVAHILVLRGMMLVGMIRMTEQTNRETTYLVGT
jgi:hypothetical protein